MSGYSRLLQRGRENNEQRWRERVMRQESQNIKVGKAVCGITPPPVRCPPCSYSVMT